MCVEKWQAEVRSQSNVKEVDLLHTWFIYVILRLKKQNKKNNNPRVISTLTLNNLFNFNESRFK